MSLDMLLLLRQSGSKSSSRLWRAVKLSTVSTASISKPKPLSSVNVTLWCRSVPVLLRTNKKTLNLTPLYRVISTNKGNVDVPMVLLRSTTVIRNVVKRYRKLHLHSEACHLGKRQSFHIDWRGHFHRTIIINEVNDLIFCTRIIQDVIGCHLYSILVWSLASTFTTL